jgi:aldose 1-epimerase
MSSTVELSNRNFRMVIAPHLGGSIVSLWYLTDSGPRLVICPPNYPEEGDHNLPQDALNCGCYPMFPYPNRIANRVLSFHGARYELEHPDPHALHGSIRFTKPISQKSNQLQYTASFEETRSYPCPFSLELTYSLEEDSVRLYFCLTNIGEWAFPFGGGFHPFFPTGIEASEKNPLLQFSAEGTYPCQDQAPIPIGAAEPLRRELNWSKPRPLLRNLDTCFAAWDGRAEILWPKAGIHMAMACSSSFDHLVIYSPEDKNFFAFEPQTQMNNGVNFLDTPGINHGVELLEPGKSLQGCVTMRFSRVIPV